VLGAETVIGPILKLIVSVAILAAVGIFIVKPILDTTEEISSQVNESVRGSIEESNSAGQQASYEAAQRRAESYAQSLQSSWPAAAREIKRCVARANTLGPMERCAEMGQRIVHTVQSDRNFALSYATSLASQGNGAAADRIRECVRDAGFATAAMQRCRKLADDLLFG
jgi:hypothetical protein